MSRLASEAKGIHQNQDRGRFCCQLPGSFEQGKYTFGARDVTNLLVQNPELNRKIPAIFVTAPRLSKGDSISGPQYMEETYYRLVKKPRVSNPKAKVFPRPGTAYGTIGGSFSWPDFRRAKVDRTKVMSFVNANSEKNATAIEVLKSHWTRAAPPYMRLSNMAVNFSKGSRTLDA